MSSSVMVVLIRLFVTASCLKFKVFCQKTVEMKQFAKENEDDDDEWKTMCKEQLWITSRELYHHLAE